MFYDITDPVDWPNGLLLSQFEISDEHKLPNASHGWSATFGSNNKTFSHQRGVATLLVVKPYYDDGNWRVKML